MNNIEPVSILISTGLVEAVTELFRDLAKKGMPSGNIYEYAARIMIKNQKKMVIKLQRERAIQRDLKYKQMKERKKLERQERIKRKKEAEEMARKLRLKEEEKRRKEA